MRLSPMLPTFQQGALVKVPNQTSATLAVTRSAAEVVSNKTTFVPHTMLLVSAGSYGSCFSQ